MRFPANPGVAFCLIAAGSCRLELPGHAPQRLDAGDYLLLCAPPAWTLSDGAATRTVDFRRPPGSSGEADRLSAVMGRSGAGTATRLLGGHFRFDEANSALLTGLAPPVVRIRASEPSAARLRNVLSLIEDEAAGDRPGRSLILERFLEIMLVEAIRHGGVFDNAHQGLMAGLADPRIAAALRALHADVRRRWTVADLAAVAGMSRSVFAERFSRVVGTAPIDYLLRWRMALAKDLLRFRSGRTEAAALACGYESPSAFSIAFKRIVGCSPARFGGDRAARAETFRRVEPE